MENCSVGNEHSSECTIVLWYVLAEREGKSKDIGTTSTD